MKKSNLFRVLCIVVTSVVLICVPESSFAAGGHGGGGGGGFHGGGGGGGFHGGGFGGGFHGGGFGGYHAGWGGAGGRGGWGGYGWRGGWGGYGGRGWGYPGWGYAGWGVGVGFGWGWGSYWAGYPYAYGYPYYPYYPYSYGNPYYPYYPYYGPAANAPADPDGYNRGNQDPHDNVERQNSSYRGPQGSPNVNNTPTMRFASHKTTGDTDSAKYWLSNYQQHTVPRQEVRNVIQALLAMPPEARRRQIESGRYRNFSPEEQELVSYVAQVSPREEPQKNVDGTKPATLRLASQQVQ
jgi:hypothetical protein